MHALAAPSRANFFRSTSRPRTSSADVRSSAKTIISLIGSNRKRPRSQGSMLEVFCFCFCPSLGHKNDAEAQCSTHKHMGLFWKGRCSSGCAQMKISLATRPQRRSSQLSFGVPRKHTHIHTRDGLSPLLLNQFFCPLPHFRSAHAFFQARGSPR